MAFTETTALHKIARLRKRIRGVSGGTSASKTISILMWLIDYAQTREGELISVVSESIPHLKRGAMRDFLNIMQQQHYYKEDLWNRTDFIYTFETGSKIEFFSADAPDKVRGPRRDVLYMNEANNMTYETYTQLEVRTRKLVWIDHNPVNEYWWYSEVMPNNDVDFLTLTYLDNEALDPSIVQSIESRKNNTAWWRVYGLGLLGEVDGKIYKGWNIIDFIPHEAKLVSRGLDFGFSNDPTTIIDVYKYNGGFILDERLYQKGMHNKPIADFLLNLEDPQMTVFADSSEPKSIDEIRTYGVNILGAKKGKDSINQGIDYLQDQRISMTKRSTNLIKEYRMYMWETDKDGKILNTAIDLWNHALDAVRYAVETYSRSYATIAGIVTSTPYGQLKTNPFEIDENGQAHGMYDIGRVVKNNAEWEDV